MTTDWHELRIVIANDRGTFCEICGCAPWAELHHCLWHKMRGHEDLDSIYNIQAVCVSCHPYANSFENRQRFWKSQCQLYGETTMQEWYDGLDLKVKERFD